MKIEVVKIGDVFSVEVENTVIESFDMLYEAESLKKQIERMEEQDALELLAAFFNS